MSITSFNPVSFEYLSRRLDELKLFFEMVIKREETLVCSSETILDKDQPSDRTVDAAPTSQNEDEASSDAVRTCGGRPKSQDLRREVKGEGVSDQDSIA